MTLPRVEYGAVSVVQDGPAWLVTWEMRFHPHNLTDALLLVAQLSGVAHASNGEYRVHMTVEREPDPDTAAVS